jgi:hypothetical protein
MKEDQKMMVQLHIECSISCAATGIAYNLLLFPDKSFISVAALQMTQSYTSFSCVLNGHLDFPY